MAKPNIGASGEYSFAAEMLARGWTPCWPSVETLPYDMIVDTGTHLWKIQVKASAKEFSKFIDFHFRMKIGKNRRGYIASDVDFVVFHLHGTTHWYVIPIHAVPVWARIKPLDPDCSFNIFLDAFNLLE